MTDSDRYEDEMWQDGFEVGYENGLEHSGDSDSDEDEEELFYFQNSNEDADECDHDYDEEDDDDDGHIDEHEDDEYFDHFGEHMPGYRRRQLKRFIYRKFKPNYDW